VGLLVLPEEMQASHRFSSVNVTLTGAECFGSPTSLTKALLPLAGLDYLVMNQLMATFETPGHFLTASGDYFTWSRSQLPRGKNEENRPPPPNPGEWLGMKFFVLISSLGAFFLMSSITALLVRVLISSGVVLLFPLFWLLQFIGLHAINLRIISLSYPWIGVPMELLRARSLSSVPFVLSHISRVIVYYCLYASAQLAFSLWFYGNAPSPSQQELWLCGLMMLWEYYSMIYVRSCGSILLFPKASICLFLIYHIYYYSFPSGLHLLALTVTALFLLFLMIHCIRAYEIKAFQQGLVSIDQPR
jgi:hypothetical protein